MKRIATILAIGCVLLLANGCASSNSVYLSMNREDKVMSITSNVNKEYRVIRHMSAEQKNPFLFIARMFPGEVKPDLDAMVSLELTTSQADAIVNVKFRGETSIGDALLPLGLGFFGGLAFPPFFFIMMSPLFEDLKTYAIEGDLVKYVEPMQAPESVRQFDPITGLPITKPPVQFDPKTGLPVRPQ